MKPGMKQPPKFTNKKKTIVLCNALSEALESLRKAKQGLPSSMSWKEENDVSRAILEIEQTTIEIREQILAASS
jgi:hypothetical protein